MCYSDEPVDSYFVPQAERSDTSLTRIHHVYRKRLCIPDAKTCPVPFEDLDDERTTEVQFRNGTKKKIIDHWRDPQHSQRGLRRPMEGENRFSNSRIKIIPKKRVTKKVIWKAKKENQGDAPASNTGSSSNTG